MVMIAGIVLPYNVHAASKNIGLVSEAEYLSKYTNKEDYKAVPYYRYSTRTKETKTSGYPSLSGWTQSGGELVSSNVVKNWYMSYNDLQAEETVAGRNDNFETVKIKEKTTIWIYYFRTCDHKVTSGNKHGSCEMDTRVYVGASKKWNELEYTKTSGDVIFNR